MSPKARLLTEQRRRNLLDLVDQQGQVTVADMVKRFAISAVTVRSDLDALASLAAMVPSPDGATRPQKATQDYPLGTKKTLQSDEQIPRYLAGSIPWVPAAEPLRHGIEPRLP